MKRYALAWGLAAFLLAGQSLAWASSVQNSYVNYYLTSGQNLRLELERLRRLTNAVVENEQAQAALKKETDDETEDSPQAQRQKLIEAKKDADANVNLGFLRFDSLMPANEKDGFLLCTLGVMSEDLRLAGGWFSFSVLGGATIFLLDQNAKSYTIPSKPDLEIDVTDAPKIITDITLGATAMLKNYVRLESNLSLIKAKSTGLDQLEVNLSSPYIGGFSLLRYGLGSKRMKDVEIGWSKGLRSFYNKWDLGILSVGYDYRFKYPITGFLYANELQPADRWTLAADHSGFVTWEQVDLAPGYLQANLGLSFGNVSKGLRYGFLELQAGPKGYYFYYARGGYALSRMDKNYYWGASGGVGVRYKHYFLLKVGVSWRDYDATDRIGNIPKKTVLQVLASGAF